MNAYRIMVGSLVITAATFLAAGWNVEADSGARVFQARLDGAHETPAISTVAVGTFRATLNLAGTELQYQLQFSGLEGGNTLFSHVHIGQTGSAGGVMYFLCGGGGKPACPNGEGTVTGTVDASNVIGPAGQGISPGQ